MTKRRLFIRILSYALTFLGGGAATTIVALIVLNWFELGFYFKTTTYNELSKRLESIPIEEICKTISSGNQILGEDHVVVWNDEKRYVVGGWAIQESGSPTFYWTGADIPVDVPECGNRS